MKHEYEAKFLSVDVAGLQAKLTALGAVREFPRTLLTRKIFENDALEGGAWLRLRDEGTRCTLTLKQVNDATTIDGTTEIETEVTDLRAMAEILGRLACMRSVTRRTTAKSGAWERSLSTSTPGLASQPSSRSRARRGVGPPSCRRPRTRLLQSQVRQR